MNYNTALNLWEQAREVFASRPMGGPQLSVNDGIVGDGYSMLARFSSQSSAVKTLRAAGFRKVSKNMFKAK